MDRHELRVLLETEQKHRLAAGVTGLLRFKEVQDADDDILPDEWGIPEDARLFE